MMVQPTTVALFSGLVLGIMVATLFWSYFFLGIINRHTKMYWDLLNEKQRIEAQRNALRQQVLYETRRN